MRGLNTKLANVFRNSVECCYDVIAFTETWLNPDIFDSEIFCSDFDVYRNDRLNNRGGGVLIAVHCSIPSECFVLSNDIYVEFICVRLSFKNKFIYITCSYIPPKSDISVYLKHANLIGEVESKLTTNDFIVTLGDFNIPSVNWIFCPDVGRLMPFSISNDLNTFFDFLFDLCLFQFNNIPNIKNRFLDLVFSNFPNICVSRSLAFVTPEDNYHPTLLICFDITDYSAIPYSNDSVKSFNFGRANFDQLKSSLLMTEWQDIDDDLDCCVSKFYDILFSAFSISVPIRKNKPAISGPVWFTKELRRVRNVKGRLFRKYKENSSSVNYMKYSVARNSYNVLNQRCYSAYLVRMKESFRVNPKSFYNFVNSKRKVSGFPASMKFEGVESSDKLGIANLFANFFQKTYSSDNALSSVYPYNIDVFNIVSDLTITSDEILKGLRNLKFSNCPGPDGIPSSILRSCADELHIPLMKFFNYSLKTGYFPSCWKESFIIPLHKNGNRRCVENYRGIAKLSVIPKLFEKIVTNRLIHMVGSLISPHQHGFVKGRSVTTNLMELTCHIFDAFSRGCQMDVIYTDFSKAFDTLNHELLLYKLNCLGFPSKLLSWILSYLRSRTQRVMFKNQTSKKISVTSGVPQGSHLGPILFVLYLNDLPSILKFSRILMYADDVKLFLPLNSNSDCNLLQIDLGKLSDWCNVNGMSLNLKKCKKLSFYRSNPIHNDYLIGSYKLENVLSFNDLGVLLDHRLNFNLHINSCVNRAKSLLGFMKRWSREFDDPYVTKNLFISLVRPVLEYASVIWSPNYGCHINSLESVQRQFLLFALRGLGWNVTDRLPPYESRLQLINLPPLWKRRLMLGVTFAVKLINGEIHSSLLLMNINFNVPSRVTRNYIPLRTAFSRHNYEEFNPLRSICSQFNEFYHLFSPSDPIYKIKRLILGVT